jgi:hypothetical protein
VERETLPVVVSSCFIIGGWFSLPWFVHVVRAEAPNDPKLSDGGPEAGAVSTAAQGEGAGCAWDSAAGAQPMTAPVGPKPAPRN